MKFLLLFFLLISGSANAALSCEERETNFIEACVGGWMDDWGVNVVATCFNGGGGPCNRTCECGPNRVIGNGPGKVPVKANLTHKQSQRKVLKAKFSEKL